METPARGLLPFDATTHAALSAGQWRKPPSDYRWFGIGLLIVLVLHAFFAAFVLYEMKPHGVTLVTRVRLDTPMNLRLIAAEPIAAPPPIALPSAPLPAKASPSPRATKKVSEAPAENAMSVTLPAAAPAAADQPRLFDQNGQIILPTTSASVPAAPQADYVQHTPQGDTQIMHDTDTVHYKPTRFAGAWREHTSAVDDVLQKVVDKTTAKTTINLPKGIRLHCAVSLAMLAGGCGFDPPPAPPSNDGDERLNMSATPLAKGIAKAGPPVAECIADYRAHKPLPYGCPVDTPTRAVDAERQQRNAAAKASSPNSSP